MQRGKARLRRYPSPRKPVLMVLGFKVVSPPRLGAPVAGPEPTVRPPAPKAPRMAVRRSRLNRSILTRRMRVKSAWLMPVACSALRVDHWALVQNLHDSGGKDAFGLPDVGVGQAKIAENVPTAVDQLHVVVRP